MRSASLGQQSRATPYASPATKTPARMFGSTPILPTSTMSSRLYIRSPSSYSSPGSPFGRRNPAGRFRPRRVALVVLCVCVLGAVLWRTRDENIAEIMDEDEKCATFPWMAVCQGKAAKGSSDPFELLHYTTEGGHLYYPAHATMEDSSAIPPSQPHPIHMLMDEAARDWQKKVDRQSKSLREAIEEYERRYRMRPPKGFAKWFEYAQANGFVLVDEFDSLHRKILPYLSLPSALLRQRNERLQHDTDLWLQDKTFTIQVRKDQPLKAVGPMLNGRHQQMISLLRGVTENLSDMNITFTGHDVPWIGLSGEARAEMTRKARAGEYMDESKFEDAQDNWDYDGWAAICPPDSPLRAAPHYETRSEVWSESKPSFIKDHVASMDLCNHPERQGLHGFTSWPGPRPGILFPILSFTSTTMHADLPAPPIEQWDYPVGEDPDWENKLKSKVVWRGATTGADLNIPHMRKWSQRPRLCNLMRQPGKITLPLAANDLPNQLGPMQNFTAFAGALATRYYDFKFLGPPEQCTDVEACAEFEKSHSWDEFMSVPDQNMYKYVIDVDGNGWSGRFHRLMSTKSMVLKSTIFPEWYADHVQPWLHYVPVATDYSDLWAIMAFFRGGRNGEGAHDELAKKIGLEGKAWAEKHWRWQDMKVYFYRLLIEYERIMNRDEDPRSADM